MDDSKLYNMGDFAKTIMTERYSWLKGDGTKETMPDIGFRVASTNLAAVNAPASLVGRVADLIGKRKMLAGGRYLYASGRDFHQVNNCVLQRVEDSREGWSGHLHKASMALMTGAGIGNEYSRVRAKGLPIKRTGGIATGPCALMQMTNEVGRGIRQGGTRRSAIWAGLNWKHPDIFEFIHMKDWSPEVVALKAKNWDFPATMDGTNISVGLDDEFFEAYSNGDSLANNVYWEVIKQMLRTGEPGFSVNCGKYSKEILRNACTEVTSEDPDDICNIGSINMARITSLGEMEDACDAMTALLVAGSVYSDIPYPEIDAVRAKNRRIGVGLMGLHEWLLIRGKKYGPDEELTKYLEVYVKATDAAAIEYSNKWGISCPVAKRAIAPNGTTGIVAETTTGCEPMLVAAYKRLYFKGDARHYQYVIDPAAKRLIEQGAKPENIEDAYTLAATPERRVLFQAYLQQYIDQSISSTINLPQWGSELNNESLVRGFGNMLIKHLPKLRGITVYPDGARGGQPIQSVSYKTASKHLGEIFVETGDVCDIAHGGTCG